MENGNGYNCKNDNTHELSPLLLVPMMEDAQTAKRSRGGKRFIALLLVVSTAAAAMTVLLHGSLSVGGTPIVSVFSPLLGNGRKRGEWCDDIWWNACGDGLSCFEGGHLGNGKYCVPVGELNACCGWSGDYEAEGIDCGKDLKCDNAETHQLLDSTCTSTCHLTNEYGFYWAKKGSCNVNTGKPANILIEKMNPI